MNTFNITINIEYTNESVIKECKLKYCYHSKQKDNYFYEAELKKDKIIISGSRKSDLNFEFNDKVKNLLYYDILNLLIYNYLHNQPFSIASIELIKRSEERR